MITLPPSEASLAYFFGLLAVMGSARIFELLVSKRYSGLAIARGEIIQPESIFPAMVVLHTLPFWMAPLEVIVLQRVFIPALAVVSTAALLIALVLRVWTLRSLGAMWNVRLVRPSAPVATGPYAFVRHPNYAVVIVELLFLPLIHTAVLTSIVVTVVNGWVLARRIPAEEAVLSSVPGYAKSMGYKPRFIPSLRRPLACERSVDVADRLDRA
jgi:methyltransferase